MAESSKPAGDGLLDMEKELTCSICTDILYQPLTLLDCLHTFCGSCLKEWFAWQATSAQSSANRARIRNGQQPYNCPSCRESVRGTKADWRLNTLLEGFLKANPEKVKPEQEREEMRQVYSPGDDVIPKVEVQEDESDSEDERLMRQVREMSMADVDPDTARRRAARNARHRRREEGGEGRTDSQYRAEDVGRTQASSRLGSQHAQLTQSQLARHDESDPQLEHQSSLRSLLSASPIDSHDVQQEILQSIYADGLLEGIDIDNLTTEQEEELTERIADAYRRRQRRERSRNRDRRRPESRSPRPSTGGPEDHARRRPRNDSTPPQQRQQQQQQQQTRTRPPVSRPHLFEQNTLRPDSRHQRSVSSTSQRSHRSANPSDAPSPSQQASRSATDLSERPMTEEAARARHRRMSSHARSTTDPQDSQLRTHISRMRVASGTVHSSAESAAMQPSTSHPLEVVRQQQRPSNTSSTSLPVPSSGEERSIRPATSTAAFAPEAITSVTPAPEPLSNLEPGRQHSRAPEVVCTRCEKPSLQYDLHFHCPWCRNGDLNLCLPCYRQGQGCDHWYGFGYMAYERWRRLAPPEGWPREYERPHVLTARRWKQAESHSNAPYPADSNVDSGANETDVLQEGAFCDGCLRFANDCYWYCFICLEGAWGWCNTCVQTGNVCTHPLLPVAHLRTQRQVDPSKTAFVQLPHLRLDSYVLLPVLTDCDICARPIPPNSTRMHCYECSHGDYDVCTECYYSLVATGKISQASGPNGWRRCLQGHRMAVVGYQDVPEAGQQRVVVRDVVGGRRHKDDVGHEGSSTLAPPPADNALGARCLAMWSYFPREGVEDELAFPKNAEVGEVENVNADWSIGVYGGKVGLFPGNHVRRV